MDFSTLLNIILSVIAALAVAVAWRNTKAANQLAKEASRIQGQLSALEQQRNLRPTLSAKKAVFDILVRSSASGDAYTFVLHNKGRGAAHDFDVLWNNELFSKAPCDTTVQRALPEVVPAGDAVILTMLPGFEDAKLRVVWCDESGEWQEQNFSYGSAQLAA